MGLMGQLDFAGLPVLITGAGSGIGRACAFEFAAQGAIVVLTERDDISGLEATAEITQAGYSAIYLPLDVTDEASVQAGFAEVARQFGSLCVLINNVGHYEE